jgi:hypothetical protein
MCVKLADPLCIRKYYPLPKAPVEPCPFNIGAEDAKVIAILGPCVGDRGVENIHVSGEAPWNGLRSNST